MKAWILAAEAFAVYGLVLWSHSLRRRYGLAFFYALLGSLTAIMSWVTDAGVQVQLGGVTFLVGSTVFYTSLLLGVFVVYVFDGPRATRVAILTVVGVSALVPVISLILHLQTQLSSTAALAHVPIPSLRINLASVATTLADLFFLAVCWEFLHGKARNAPLMAKAFLTLLGVMWLDVVFFNTGAFLGSPEYLSILSGTLVSRLIITVFAAPILWGYLSWQSTLSGVSMPHRPVFAILQELSELRVELQTAQEEIERRKLAEASLARSEMRYRQLIANASEPIAVVRDDLYQLHNAMFLELTGIGEEEIGTANFSTFIHEGDRHAVACEMDEAIRKPGRARSVEFKAQRGGTVVQANIVGIEWDGRGAILAFLHDVTEQRQAERKLMDEAIQDPLTGVLNRRGFTEKFEDSVKALTRRDRPYCALYLDLDGFKAVNDQYGHSAGDKVLLAAAGAISSHVRGDDLVGRMGGDEFAVLLAGADEPEAMAIARRILEGVRSSCELASDNAPRLSASIGCARGGKANQDQPLRLIDQADQAMLDAKRAGGDRVAAA
jgi:diguanylate cyclase (GGDEF)-like protein/PAS domain S-box-containing protein